MAKRGYSSLVALTLLAMMAACKSGADSGYAIILMAPRSGAQAALGLQIDRARILVEKELKDKENLNTVYFEGNPLQLKNPTLYRNKVRLALPQIMQIDASKSLGKFYSHRQEGWALFKVRVKVC